MKKMFLLLFVVSFAACTNKTGRNDTGEDSLSQVAEVAQENPYVSVSSASEADVIEFVAEGNFSPVQVSGRPQEIWKYVVETIMEKEGGVCKLKVHSEKWDEGASKCKSQFTDEFNGHWTIKASIQGRRTQDWYCYTAFNDKGEKFAFRVNPSFTGGYSEVPAFDMMYNIRNVEMKRFRVREDNAMTNSEK